MRAGLAFFAGAWAGWIIAAANSVYALGHLVRPYTASASFTMLAFASILPSLAVGVAAWLGSLGRSTPWAGLALPAAAMGGLSVTSYLAAEAMGMVHTAVGLLVVWVALPAVAFTWARRLVRRDNRTLESAPSDQSGHKG